MKNRICILILILILFITLNSCKKNSPTSNAPTDEITSNQTTAIQSENENTSAIPSTTAEPRKPDVLTPDFEKVSPVSDGLLFREGFRRGINLGNTFEAPAEGEWGVIFEDEFFVKIRENGFDFVRLPVSWSSHYGKEGIDADFLNRIIHVVDEAQKNKLGIIINIHHFYDMFENPEKYKDELYDIWTTISETFQNYPDNVLFEILNEPNTQLVSDVWNTYQNECIKIIRKTNPARKIVVSGGDWGGEKSLWELKLPEDDKNLILSFHYYDPFNFTHQGADWGDGDMEQYLGTKWTASEAEKKFIESTFTKVKNYSKAVGIPVLLGEFGAYSKGDMDSRAKWTAFVRETAERYGFAWSYWEFCSGFGIYNKDDKTFYTDLLNALTGTPQSPDYAGADSSLNVEVTRENGFIGPVKIKRQVEVLCDTWTNITSFDTPEGTVILDLGGNVAEWAQAYINLDGVTETASGFSKEVCELTIRNIDKSITDFCINVDNSGTSEAQALWMNEKELNGTGENVAQNADGTVTFTIPLSKAFSQLKGKCENGIRLKMFIESVPTRASGFDKAGRIEFLKCELK